MEDSGNPESRICAQCGRVEGEVYFYCYGSRSIVDAIDAKRSCATSLDVLAIVLGGPGFKEAFERVSGVGAIEFDHILGQESGPLNLQNELSWVPHQWRLLVVSSSSLDDASAIIRSDAILDPTVHWLVVVAIAGLADASDAFERSRRFESSIALASHASVRDICLLDIPPLGLQGYRNQVGAGIVVLRLLSKAQTGNFWKSLLFELNRQDKTRAVVLLDDADPAIAPGLRNLCPTPELRRVGARVCFVQVLGISPEKLRSDGTCRDQALAVDGALYDRHIFVFLITASKGEYKRADALVAEALGSLDQSSEAFSLLRLSSFLSSFTRPDAAWLEAKAFFRGFTYSTAPSWWRDLHGFIQYSAKKDSFRVVHPLFARLALQQIFSFSWTQEGLTDTLSSVWRKEIGPAIYNNFPPAAAAEWYRKLLAHPKGTSFSAFIAVFVSLGPREMRIIEELTHFYVGRTKLQEQMQEQEQL
eukprot:m51a1_g1279 hypothetical protein (475) ;mRNA; f:115304-121287